MGGYAIIPPMLPPPLAIAPQLSNRGRAARNFLAARSGLILCALFALISLALVGEYGINYDESTQRHIAAANWDYIRGRPDGILVKTEPNALELSDRLYGVAFELPLLLAERGLGLADYHDVHRLRLTLTHLFFILGGYFCYRLAWRLFDNRLIAALALLFYLLHPRLYAQSYINSKDPVFLSMFVLALYLLERAFRRDTIGAFVLLGLGVGLLTNLRIMGITLFPAVIALRGLDLFQAKTGPERKAILLTGALFLLAGGLTAYALAPYAWTNPADYLAASLALTVNHPFMSPQLFRGDWFLADQLPPHYLPVWFAITTPPPFLLLGFIGIAAVAARIFRRPAAAFRNNRWRLLLLLAAGFLLTLLTVVLLRANQYEGWHHSFFIYAPFCLLAAGGLHWLAATLSRQRRWRPAIYGLGAAGLALIAFQMIQLHPLQNDYFNFLADRTAPEWLRTQYIMDYYRMAQREGLEYLRESYPGEFLTVRTDLRQYNTLAPAARRRLRPAAVGIGADYDLIYPHNPGQPDLAFNAEYQRRIYNNTLMSVRPLDAARMTPAAIAAYRELYAAAVAGEPIIRADYDVYRHGQRLTFVQENCPPEGGDVWFGVRFFPHYPEILPPHLWNSGSYVTFQTNRVRLGALCLAVLQLPDYADQGDLILMQRNLGNYWPEGLPAWTELYSLSQPGLGELIANYRRNLAAPPATEFGMGGKGPAGAFEVFIDRDDGRNRLIYAKADCAQSEYETPITLHIAPLNRADLPDHRRASGFDNRDFPLDWYGGRPGGDCVAIVPLPDYPIQAIRTGQGDRWEVNLYPLTEPDYLRETYAALSDQQPAARSDFDLYIQEGQLLYRRETCNAADTAANFFLHIIPQDIADLPAERRAAGFANRDFAFDQWGGHFDGKCLAAAPLPDYPIKALRTGQHTPGQGELWVVTLPAE